MRDVQWNLKLQWLLTRKHLGRMNFRLAGQIRPSQPKIVEPLARVLQKKDSSIEFSEIIAYLIEKSPIKKPVYARLLGDASIHVPLTGVHQRLASLDINTPHPVSSSSSSTIQSNKTNLKAIFTTHIGDSYSSEKMRYLTE